MGKQRNGIKNLVDIENYNPQTTGKFKPIKGLIEIDTSATQDRSTTRANIGNLGLGESQFDENVPQALLNNLQQVRAERQPWHHQAGSALGRGIIGGLATGVETMSYILDVPGHVEQFTNILKKDEDIDLIESNTVGKAAKDFKESLLQDFLPIYRKNPDKLIDFGDSGFYWESLGSVIDSAVGFGLTGLGAGAGVKLAGKALRMARIQAYNSQVANGLTRMAGNVGKGLQQGTAGRVTAAYLTNYGEGKMMGLELYENSQKEILNEYIEQYKEDNEGAEPTKDKLKEFKFDAKIQAGRQANNFMLTNKMFMLTDYLQLNSLFKGSKLGTRNLVKQPAFTKLGKLGQFGKTQLKAGPKESLEEIGQNIFQMEGIQQARQSLKESGYNLSDKEVDDMSFAERVVEFGLSEQALLEGAMGFLGGPIQYTITQMPFESSSQKSKQFANQQRQIGQNEKFIEENLYNIATNEAVSDAAKNFFEKEDLEKHKDVVNNAAFTRLAMMNFTKGTTEDFESKIQEFIADENNSQESREGAKKKLELLQQLETNYNKYEGKYAEPTLLIDLESHKNLAKDTRRLINEQSNQLESILREHVDLFNQASDSNYSLGAYRDSPEDTSGVFQKHMKGMQNELVLLRTMEEQSKEFSKIEAGYNSDISDIKNPSNNAILADFKEFYEDINNPTNEKIEEGRQLAKSATGFVKSSINRRLDELEKMLNEAKKNDVAESNGGIEQDEIKGKEKERSSIMADSDDEVDEEMNFQIQSMLSQSETSPTVKKTLDTAMKHVDQDMDIATIAMASMSDPEVSEDQVASLLEKGVITAQRAGEISDIEADEAIKHLKSAFDAGTLEDSSEDNFVFGETPSAASTEKPVQNDIQHESLKNSTPDEDDIDGVKTMFHHKYISSAFKSYLETNTNKQGLPVRFRIGNANKKAQQNAINKLKEGKTLTSNQRDIIPIEVVINDQGKEFVTALFPVNTKDGNAATKERELRDQIVEKLSQGQTPQGTVQYQYSGAILSDGVEKNIRTISELEDINDIELMYTNEDGRKINVNEERSFNTEFTDIVRTKGNVWSGIFFTTVTDANGNKHALKLNSRKLNKNEIDTISNILIGALDRNNKDAMKTPISNYPGIMSRLEGYDLEYLGENANLGTLLNYLVYEGEQTKELGPQSRLYFKDSKLYIGDRVLTLENINSDPTNLEYIKKFLYNFKRRNISVDSLINDAAYKEMVINNAVLNTDASINSEGEVFQIDTETDTRNPENRYRTKSLYVSNKLDNKNNKPKATKEKTSTKQVKADVKETMNKTKPRKNTLLSNVKATASKTTEKPSKKLENAKNTEGNNTQETSC